MLEFQHLKKHKIKLCKFVELKIMLGGRRDKASNRTNNPSRLTSASEPPSPLYWGNFRKLSKVLQNDKSSHL